MRNVLILLGAAGAVVLAGCGSDAPSSASSSAASPTPSSPTSSSPPPSTSSSPAPATSSSSSAALQAALLTAAEVGSDFAVQPSSQDNQPLPCTPSAKPIFEQFTPAAKVERNFATSNKSLLVDEAIAQYDEATAKQVFAAAVEGFSCGSATIGGQSVTITKRPGAQSTGEVQTAAWDFAVGGQPGTAAVTRIGTKFAAISFTATKAAANDINVPEVLQKAGTKIAALP